MRWAPLLKTLVAQVRPPSVDLNMKSRATGAGWPGGKTLGGCSLVKP